MATDRGRQRTVRGRKDRHAPPRRPCSVRLADGVRLHSGEKQHEVAVLIAPTGKVQLNAGAVAILRLCDGSRDRAEIIAEIVRQSHHGALAGDVAEFLDVAQVRGWIVEE
jgi:pyrroloquinoline quinone biosynthesis protein D